MSTCPRSTTVKEARGQRRRQETGGLHYNEQQGERSEGAKEEARDQRPPLQAALFPPCRHPRRSHLWRCQGS